MLLRDSECDWGACGEEFQGRSPIEGIGPPWITIIKYKNYFTIRIASPFSGKACVDIDVGDHGIGTVHCYDFSKRYPRGPNVFPPARIPGPFPVIFNPCLIDPGLPGCLPRRPPN